MNRSAKPEAEVGSIPKGQHSTWAAAQPETFRDLVARHFGCSAHQYEEVVFRHCLYGHAKVVAPLLRRLAPGLFAADLELIRYVAEVRDLDRLRAEIRLHYLDRPPDSCLRGCLRLRVSGRRLFALGEQVFGKSLPAPTEHPRQTAA